MSVFALSYSGRKELPKPRQSLGECIFQLVWSSQSSVQSIDFGDDQMSFRLANSWKLEILPELSIEEHSSPVPDRNFWAVCNFSQRSGMLWIDDKLRRGAENQQQKQWAQQKR